MTTTITSRAQLEEVIRDDIVASGAQNAVIMAGHFPYVVKDETVVTTNYWSDFTRETFDIACKLIADGKLGAVKSKIAVVMDDINYIPPNTPNSLRRTQRYNIFRSASGDNPTLPDVFAESLDKYGLSSDVLVTQDQGKYGRHDSRIISERGLLGQVCDDPRDRCAISYRNFIADYANADSFVCSMIPSPCYKSICSAVADEGRVNTSNAYFLFDRDFQKEMLVSDMFERGLVVYKGSKTE